MFSRSGLRVEELARPVTRRHVKTNGFGESVKSRELSVRIVRTGDLSQSLMSLFAAIY